MPKQTNAARRVSMLMLSTILASGLAAPAFAQDTPEPYRNNDEHGVDLVTGTFNAEIAEGGIGPASGGVTMVRYLGRSGYGDNWSGDLRKISEAGQFYVIITFGNISERFKKVGNGWIAEKANGATLVENANLGIFDYLSSDGTAISFGDPKALALASPNDTIEMPSNFCKTSNALACGVPTKITTAKQVEYDLHWSAARQCPGGGPPPEEGGPESPPCTVTYRLGDVRSNSGYAMKIKYQSDSSSAGNGSLPPTGWWNRSTLKFMDLSQVYCGSLASNCDGVAGSWPTVSYAYPTSGVLDIVNSQNGTWRIDRSNSLQLKIRRPGAANDSTIVNFGSDGRVSSITSNGATQNYSWTTGASTSVTSTSGGGESSTVVSTLAVGQPSSATNGTSNATSYIYDVNNRVTRETRPEGDYTNYTYDARGNVTEMRHVAKPNSGIADIVSTADYDANCTNFVKCNKPNFTVDALAGRTDYSYDPSHGELTWVQLPAATTGGIRPEVNYVYSSLTAQVRDVSGNLVPQPVAQAKLTQITSCATAATCPGSADETKVTIAYNSPNLLPTSVTTASGDGLISATTSYAYDARDNLIGIDGPLAGSDDAITYIYDSFDRRRGAIGPDPDGSGNRPRLAERYTFNTESRVTKVESGTVTAATGAALDTMTPAQTVDIVYDSNGNVVRQNVSGTSGVAQVSQLSYDADNRLSCTAQRMNPAVFASLPASACTLGTQGTGAGDYGPDRIVQNSYDASGRIILVKTALGTADQADEVASAYTPNGQLSHMVDAEANRTAYVYDGHDRLHQTRYPMPAKGANAANVNDYEQLGYDAGGNVTSRRLRDGQSIAFNYDKLGRLTLKDLPGSEPDVSYGYDLLGRMTSASQTNNALSFGWDALGRNTSQGGPQGTLNYGYDAASRRTSMAYPAIAGASALTVNYDHDVTGNLTAVRENNATSGSGVLAAYAYDNLGRRQSLTYGNGVVQSYSYDASQRLGSIASNLGGTAQDVTASFAYNPASQLDSVSKSNDAYAWTGHWNKDVVSAANGLNQLTAATPGSGQTSVPTLTYDSKGNTTGIGASSYAYSSQNQLVSGPNSAGLTYDPAMRLYKIGNSSVTTKFQYDGSDLIAEYSNGNTLLRRYVHGPGADEPLVQYEGTTLTNKRYLTRDERGSVIAVTDSAGTSIATNKYDEYGNPASTNASIANGGRFGFTGQTWLPELSLWHYKARFYNPSLGRFMQTDPIGYGDGMNWYNYVDSDPVNMVDSEGLSFEDIMEEAGFGGRWVRKIKEVCVGGYCSREYFWVWERDDITKTFIIPVLDGLLKILPKPPAPRDDDESFDQCMNRVAGNTARNVAAGSAGIVAGSQIVPYPRATPGGAGTSPISMAARKVFSDVPRMGKTKILGTNSVGGAIGRVASTASVLGGAAVVGYSAGAYAAALKVCKK